MLQPELIGHPMLGPRGRQRARLRRPELEPGLVPRLVPELLPGRRRPAAPLVERRPRAMELPQAAVLQLALPPERLAAAAARQLAVHRREHRFRWGRTDSRR